MWLKKCSKPHRTISVRGIGELEYGSSVKGAVLNRLTSSQVDSMKLVVMIGIHRAQWSLNCPRCASQHDEPEI